jgi:hypothetical protein
LKLYQPRHAEWQGAEPRRANWAFFSGRAAVAPALSVSAGGLTEGILF